MEADRLALQPVDANNITAASGNPHSLASSSQQSSVQVSKDTTSGSKNQNVAQHCCIRYDNGDVYCGEVLFSSGRTLMCCHGIGTYRYGNGDVYRGRFFRHKRHDDGNGVMEYANGDVYKGGWRRDRRSGLGVYCWASSGDVFEGHFKRDKKSGRGVLTFANGDKLEGVWKGDELLRSEKSVYTPKYGRKGGEHRYVDARNSAEAIVPSIVSSWPEFHFSWSS